MDPVTHFEFPYEDKLRMVDFYHHAFGWKSEILGSEMDDYVLVTAAERGADSFPKEPGRINGGFYKKAADKPLQYPSVVIAVEDLEESMRKIKAAGGQILGEPWDIPGIGIYISFLDTEGNRIGIMQSTMGK